MEQQEVDSEWVCAEDENGNTEKEPQGVGWRLHGSPVSWVSAELIGGPGPRVAVAFANLLYRQLTASIRL
jgi:hypothetical protein